MCKFVAASYHKSVKFIFRIQICVLIVDIVGGVRGLFLLQRFYVVFLDEFHIIEMVEHLRDGDLKKALIFRRDIIEHVGLLGRDDDAHHIVLNRVKSQRFHPGHI